jgi:transcriptional regulator with XRE-family HTH domain
MSVIHIGTVIRAVRQAKGFGVNEFASRIDVEPSNYSRFERGAPGGIRLTSHLDQIASALNTRKSVLYLLLERAQEKGRIAEKDELLQELKRLGSSIEKI